MKEIAKNCGPAFSDTKTETPVVGKKWYGFSGPYLNLLTEFSLRWKELRLGNAEFPFTKENNISKSYSIQKFGLTRAHYVSPEGIRFPPERKSSMAQSLGPMTFVMCYSLATLANENKFKEAVKKSLAHIPNVEGMFETLKEKYKSITKIFQEAWLQDPLLKMWLAPDKHNEKKCRCKICGVELAGGKSELIKHSLRRKHVKNMNAVNTLKLLVNYFVDKSEKIHVENVKKAEIRLSVFLATMAVDHLVPLLKTIFGDSRVCTDIEKKNMCSLVRYCDLNTNKVETNLLELISLHRLQRIKDL
ncbi:unnamed protein product [Phaedon cochleariae]|uniref:Uncharacterized protein n=1 Tax=Phaedon cochleariae TaxID=80249 RepID=A0A9N9X0S9_PHACE|nr:unnamed protein product [Phaedon cochleariae]